MADISGWSCGDTRGPLGVRLPFHSLPVLRGNQIRRSSVAYSNIFQLFGVHKNRNLNHRQSPTHSPSISNYCRSFPGSSIRSIEASEKSQGSHVEMSSDIGKAITDQNWIANKIPKTFRRPQWFGHKATMENQWNESQEIPQMVRKKTMGTSEIINPGWGIWP